MNSESLEQYLHQHIPLSRHMGLRVREAGPECLRVHLPLAPNVNPHGTVFGGALAALGLVSAWMLLYTAFARAGIDVTLVGKQGQCDFLAPAAGDCIAETTCTQAELDALLTQFQARGRARQTLTTRIRVGEVEVARHLGVYTALTPTDHRNPAT